MSTKTTQLKVTSTKMSAFFEYASKEDSGTRNMRYDERLRHGPMRDKLDDLMFNCGFNTEETEAAYPGGFHHLHCNEDLPKTAGSSVPEKFNRTYFKGSKLGELPARRLAQLG